MSTVVLVHGAWHGAWCWEKVTARLQQNGHNAIPIDLPGRAGDPTPHRELTLDHYVRRVAQVIERQPEPVILAGHSLGGATVAQVCEAIPAHILRAVYVAAFLPQAGQSVADLGQNDGDSSLPPALIIDQELGSFRLSDDASLRDIFYGQCSDADIARATAMLVPEPFTPAATPLSTTPLAFGAVPRAYVECLRDRALPIASQRRMQAALPCDTVLTLDTDHSPFYSAVDELARFLGEL